MMKLILIVLLSWASVAFADGGTVGNGGDPYVVEYLQISGEICSWAQGSPSKEFPRIRECNRVMIDFRTSLKPPAKAKIEFVNTPLVDDSGVSKVAIYNLKEGSVKVHRPTWEALNRKNKYVTAAIELAGLSEVENRYDFGALVESQFSQGLGSISFPKFSCSFGSHEGVKNTVEFEFSSSDVEEYNKGLEDLYGNPNEKCGFCFAGKKISLANAASGYKIELHREYLIDRPYGLRVGLLNAKGQTVSTTWVDAYMNYIKLEYFSANSELTCERRN